MRHILAELSTAMNLRSMATILGPKYGSYFIEENIRKFGLQNLRNYS